MRRALGVSALVLAGCAEADATFVSIDRFESDLGFVLTVDASGGLTGLQGPLRLDEAEPIRVVLPEGDAASVLFVGWTHEALSAEVPSYDPGRAMDSRLSSGAEACSTGELSVDGERLEVPLPEPAEWLALEESEGWRPRSPEAMQLSQLGPLSLTMAPDTTRCLGEPELRFEPYGGLDPIIRVGDVASGRALEPGEAWFRDLERLPDDRIIATTKYTVFLLERGVPFVDGPGRSVSLLDPQSPLALRDVAVDLDPRRGNGGLRIFVSGVDDLIPEQSSEGALYELRLGSAGLELVGTATRANGPIESLVLRPEDGRLIAGSRPGLIYTMLPGAELERVLLPTVDDKRVDIFLTGLADRPYAIVGTAPGTLLLGDPSARLWEIDRGLPDGATFRAFAIRRPGGQAQLWAGNSSGAIYHNAPDGSWRNASPRLGPPYGQCFSRDPVCGWYEAAQSARAIVPLDEYTPARVLVSVDGCSGLIAMRTDLACAVVTPLGDRPIAATALDSDLKTVSVNESWVTFATQDGSIYELPRRPP